MNAFFRLTPAQNTTFQNTTAANVSAQLYTHLIRIALLLAILCWIAPAEAASGWNEVTAPPVYTVDCLSGLEEPLSDSSIAWYGDPNNPPQVNTVYYVRVRWAVTGNPCAGGANVAPELFLPAGSTLAISAANPVTCFFVNLTTSASGQETRQCPQTPSPGMMGGLGFYPVPLTPPPPGGNNAAWPTAYGYGWEIHVPILSTMPLSGIVTSTDPTAACASCLTAAVWSIDGVDYLNGVKLNKWAYPRVGVEISGSPSTPTITYPSPSAVNVTTTSATGTAYLNPTGASGTAFFEKSATPPSSSTCQMSSNTRSVPQNSAALTLTASFTSLTPGTVYYWRLCYNTAGGAAYIGAAQSFQTAGTPTPRILSISPAMAVPGDSVTITGVGLTGATAVVIHGAQVSASATITSRSATSVTFTVPGAAQTGTVSVTTPGGVATSTSVLTIGIDTILDSFLASSLNGGTALNDVTIHYHSTEPAASAQYDCILDGGPTAKTCDAGVVYYYDLSIGPHTVQITAHAGGISDPTPLMVRFLLRDRIYTILPPVNTTLLTGPTGSITTNTATFTFTSHDAESSFECSQNPNGGWVPCSSPHTLKGLPAGMNFFAVRARDTAGNVDTAPATTSFSVDPLPLETVLLTSFPGPHDKTTTSRTASFSFQSKNGVGFQCSVDQAAWQPCEGPVFLDNLAVGPHTFMTRAVDSAGNVDPSPATKSWTIE